MLMKLTPGDKNWQLIYPKWNNNLKLFRKIICENPPREVKHVKAKTKIEYFKKCLQSNQIYNRLGCYLRR